MIRQFFIITLAALMLNCGQRPNRSEANEPVIEQNDLPNLPLLLSDGSKINGRDLKGATIFVLFHPDCDHCQREARQISDFSESFKAYQVYFISSAPIPEIIEFGRRYGLAGKPNFLFAQAEFNDVLKSYGSIDTPSLYIYSKEKKLVQAFNGETAIEVIAKYL